MTTSSPSLGTRRAAVIADFAEALVLLRAHIGAVDRAEARSYLAVTPASLQDAFGGERAGLLLGIVDGATVGMIAYAPFAPPCVKLNYFYVAPESRGCGLGALLLETALAAARSDGYFSAILSTLPELHAARALYAAKGFARIPPAFPDIADAEYFLRQL